MRVVTRLCLRFLTSPAQYGGLRSTQRPPTADRIRHKLVELKVVWSNRRGVARRRRNATQCRGVILPQSPPLSGWTGSATDASTAIASTPTGPDYEALSTNSQHRAEHTAEFSIRESADPQGKFS